MIAHVRPVIDLFRTVIVQEKGVEDLSLPELTDIKYLCETVIEMADERVKEYQKENGED